MKKTAILALLVAGLLLTGCPQPTDPTGGEDTTLDDAKELDFATDLEKFGQDSDANWMEGYTGMSSGVHILPGDYGMLSLTTAKETTDGADQVAEFDIVAKTGTDGTGAAVSFDATSMIKFDLGTSRFQWDSDNYGSAQDLSGKTVSVRMNIPQGYIDAGMEIKFFMKDTSWASLYPATPFTLSSGWQTYTLDLSGETGPDFTIIDIVGLNIAIDGTTTAIDLDALVALDPIQIDWINWE